MQPDCVPVHWLSTTASATEPTRERCKRCALRRAPHELNAAQRQFEILQDFERMVIVIVAVALVLFVVAIPVAFLRTRVFVQASLSRAQ